MFKCQLCGKLSKPREKVNRRLLEKRMVTHVDKVFDAETRRWKELHTKGYQITKEAICCDKCAEVRDES